jgi:hypothetical protein
MQKRVYADYIPLLGSLLFLNATEDELQDRPKSAILSITMITSLESGADVSDY